MTPEHEDNNPSVDTTVAEPLRSPGGMIRQARERAGLSLEELAAQTKLARHTLEALERDDFNALLEPVYVRGYYRKCAKVLDIPEKGLIDTYQARVSPKAPAAPSKLRLASGTDLGSGSRLPISIAIVIALIAVVVVSIAWFAREQQQTVPPSVAARAGTAPVASSDAVDVEGEGAGTPEFVAPTTSESLPPPAVDGAPPPVTSSETAPATSTAPSPAAPLAGTAPATPAPAPGTAPTTTPAAPAASPATPAPTGASGQVKLSFTVTSWVRVDDAGGKTLLNDLVRPGETRALSGALPLSIFLGNAPGVQVEFEGQAVDITRMTRDNNTARFTLPVAR